MRRIAGIDATQCVDVCGGSGDFYFLLNCVDLAGSGAD